MSDMTNWPLFFWLAVLVPLCMIILQVIITYGISLIRIEHRSLRDEIEVVRVDVNGNLRETQQKLDSALGEIIDLKDEIANMKAMISSREP